MLAAQILQQSILEYPSPERQASLIANMPRIILDHHIPLFTYMQPTMAMLHTTPPTPTNI